MAYNLISAETENSKEVNSAWGEILDELKLKEGIVSDLKLAETLGVSRAFISSIRRFQRKMPIELGEKILIRLDRKLTMQESLMFVPLSMQKRTNIRFMPNLANKIENKRANYSCELCGNAAPFVMPDETSHLEAYHIAPINKDVKDTTDNTVALCPNCHRKMELNPSIDDMQLLINLIEKRAIG